MRNFRQLDVCEEGTRFTLEVYRLTANISELKNDMA